MAFDRQKFNVDFEAALVLIRDSEKVTKATLRDLSRVLLEQLLFDSDIQPVNRLLDVLTPVNRKVAVLYFMAFSGHLYSMKDAKFGKRDKPHFEAKQKAAIAFLEDPHNNIWSWAEREVDVEPKPFTLLKVTKFVESALKKAEAAGVKQEDFVRAILAGGLEVAALSVVLADMAQQGQEEKQEQGAE